MDLHNALFDGSPRPSWAGPVTTLARPRSRRGRRSQAVEVSGVVVPVQVHPRYIPAAGHGHTFGLGLGFPSLGSHLLNPSRNPQLSRQWARMERTIAESAAQLLGWRERPSSRTLIHAPTPGNALHLRVTGHVPMDGDDEELAHDPAFSLAGEVAKLLPVRDASGRRLRMQQVGSASVFHINPLHASWSRDPRHL